MQQIPKLWDMMHYMFIRWQNYRSVARRHWHRAERPPVTRCTAVLVKSVRVDGEPRRKHIACIASYHPPLDVSGRMLFWRRARKRLDQIANWITAEDRVKIEAALASHVTPTTLEHEEACERAFAESFRRLKELIR
jgi:hypothetical protein